MTYGAYENVCYKTIIFSSRLLHENPHLKSLFAFMNVNGAPFDSPMFKSHVRNVFTVIGDAVSHIDDLDSLSPILKDLGVKHQGYCAKREYLEVNRIFFFALKYTNKGTLYVLISTDSSILRHPQHQFDLNDWVSNVVYIKYSPSPKIQK